MGTSVVNLVDGVFYYKQIPVVKLHDTMLGYNNVIDDSGKTVEETFNKFIDIAFRMDIDGLNGRIPIYEDCLQSLKEYPIFGKGVLSTFQGDGTYAWGHSTILQTVRTMGWVGIIGMTIHLFQKYYVLLNRPTLWKIITAASFAISGLYGLFDVSYYFISYMIPLVLGMAIIECLFKDGGRDEYEILY